MASGDFNSDGIPDLAIANAGSNNVTILLGNGSGGFTANPGGPVPAGAQPSSVVSGDFNGDGKADLAVANSSGNSVTVLLGNGAGAFTEPAGSPIAIGTSPFSLAIADINGDGIEDLITVNSSDKSLTLLLGNGAGGFTASIGGRLTVGTNPTSVAVGDFNADSIQDLAVANPGSGDVTVLLGTGSGGFTQPAGSPFTSANHAFSLAVGDFDGDGIQDLAAATNISVSVLHGNGSGVFTDVYDGPSGTEGANSIVVGDFNGDGKQDLATVSLPSNTFSSLLADGVTLQLGDGTGAFTVATGSPYPTGTSPVSIITADFNGDGVLDLAIANSQDGNVTVLLGLVVGQTPQAITFGGLSNQLYGVTPYAISATSSSGLPVGFASASPAVCTVAGNTVTILGGITCTIVASQAGDATYAAAATVVQSFTVNLPPQTITFGPLNNVSLGAAPFNVSATASSGGDVFFSASTPNVCTVSGNTVTILGAGACSIAAFQPGNFTTVGIGFATQSFFVVTGALCNSVVTNPINPAEIRQEGTEEQVSDVVLSCTGGNGQPMNITARISPAVSITSLTLGSGGDAVSEAVAGLNSSSTTLASGAVNGVVSGSSITFTGVPTATGTFSITVANIRMNASQITSNPPSAVTETIQVSGAGVTPITIDNPPVFVAYASA